MLSLWNSYRILRKLTTNGTPPIEIYRDLQVSFIFLEFSLLLLRLTFRRPIKCLFLCSYLRIVHDGVKLSVRSCLNRVKSPSVIGPYRTPRLRWLKNLSCSESYLKYISSSHFAPASPHLDSLSFVRDFSLESSDFIIFFSLLWICFHRRCVWFVRFFEFFNDWVYFCRCFCSIRRYILVLHVHYHWTS